MDQLNELIDLMTMAEETRLSEHMRELEQLEADKRQRMAAAANLMMASTQPVNKDKSPLIPTTASGLFSFMKKSSPAAAAAAVDKSPKHDLFEFMNSAGVQSSGSSSMMGGSSGLSNIKSITDLFSNANDEFEREWQSVLNQSQNSQQQQQQQKPAQQESNSSSSTHQQTSTDGGDGTISPSNTEFSLFAGSAGLTKDLNSNLFSTADDLFADSNKPAASATSSSSQNVQQTKSTSNNSKSSNKVRILLL